MARGLKSSARVSRREDRSSRRRNDEALIKAAAQAQKHHPAVSHVRKKKVIIEPRTAAQELYDRSIEMNTITISTGPWGTGKTWLAVARMAQAFIAGETERLIFTRPAVAADEELGFLPGDLDEKWAPWFKPMRDVLAEVMGSGALEYALKDGRIEIAPLGLLRGNTFRDAWVMADEMQNSTVKQMMMFLSRIGEGSKMIINGDPRQKDIEELSGLEDAIARVHGRVGSVGLVEFGPDDIVRSGIAREIFLAYYA